MAASQSSPRIPPRWIIRLAWVVHRGLYGATRGRIGLRLPTARRWGMLRLHTTGRRSGAERVVILAYLEDGPNLVLMAMNGWADPAPAWWLNLRAHPDAAVDLPGREARQVTARESHGDERARLWSRFKDVTRGDLDAFAARRTSTPLIVLEPRPAPGDAAHRPGSRFAGTPAT